MWIFGNSHDIPKQNFSCVPISLNSVIHFGLQVAFQIQPTPLQRKPLSVLSHRKHEIFFAKCKFPEN